MEQLTCKQKVKGEYKKECKNLSTLFAVMYGKATPKQKIEFTEYFGPDLTDKNENQIQEAAQEAICNYGLSLDYVAPGTFKGQRAGYLRWQISWGGPSDEWRFYFVPGERAPYKIEYWFLDWFDGAKVTCTNSKIALELWNYVEGADIPRSEYDKAMQEQY